MNTLKAEKRSMDVKAKRLRREGYVTGNVFGREIEGSIPVKMLKTEVDKLLKIDHKGSQVMLDVEGQTYDVLIKEVDFNPLAGRIDEIDFQALVSNEKVHSVAGIVIVNHDKVADGVIQENMEEKQQSSKTLFLNTLSDEELLREIHECKIEYKEAEIIIFDGQSGSEKKNFDHNTVA